MIVMIVMTAVVMGQEKNGQTWEIMGKQHPQGLVTDTRGDM